ncbi:MAG: hypothetical protein N3D75_02115 [Candidatus Aenigmarchaeota archaeon]|nr:hypothetical protein [Candidatus Aenigmarchaeota archaeon]
MRCECGGYMYYEFENSIKITDICLICGSTKTKSRFLSFLF